MWNNGRNPKTEEEPKLAMAKGCLWSVLLSIPLWALLIYVIWKQ